MALSPGPADKPDPPDEAEEALKNNIEALGAIENDAFNTPPCCLPAADSVEDGEMVSFDLSFTTFLLKKPKDADATHAAVDIIILLPFIIPILHFILQ